MNYLNRSSAPFDDGVWAQIDAEAVKAASDMLTGRRFLELDGPYGVGLTSLEIGHDNFCREAKCDEAVAIGSRAISVPMLRKSFKLSIRRLDSSLQTVLQAVTCLDAHSFRGPYALALSPALYNGLYRRYSGTDMLQVEHLKRLCSRGVYKAPIEGAVLVDPRAARLVMGQDLLAGYTKQDGVHCEMFLSESLAVVIDDPKAICRLITPAT
jgi:uncharacterized linocin/CFP29 family protein